VLYAVAELLVYFYVFYMYTVGYQKFRSDLLQCLFLYVVDAAGLLTVNRN